MAVNAPSWAARAKASAAGSPRKAPIRGAGTAVVGISHASAVAKAEANRAFSLSNRLRTSSARSLRPASPSQRVTGCVRLQFQSGTWATWCCQRGRNSSALLSGRHPSSTTCPRLVSTPMARWSPATISGSVGPNFVAVIKRIRRRRPGPDRSRKGRSGGGAQCGLPSTSPAMTSSMAAASLTVRVSGPEV